MFCEWFCGRNIYIYYSLAYTHNCNDNWLLMKTVRLFGSARVTYMPTYKGETPLSRSVFALTGQLCCLYSRIGRFSVQPDVILAQIRRCSQRPYCRSNVKLLFSLAEIGVPIQPDPQVFPGYLAVPVPGQVCSHYPK